jgi:NAD(P)-dependent dehydrogenase (short-subunit alcohol dehydrogenase family)
MYEFKTVLITGAGSGIGDAVAERFLAEGFRVIGWDLKPSSNSKITWKSLDVGNWEQVKSAADDLPPLHAAITCAGISSRGGLVEAGPEEFRKVMSVNLDGTAFTAMAAFESLKAGKGSLVTIGSITAINGFHHRAIYSASKGAVVSLTRCIANEWAEFGVRAFCVSPGFVETSMAKAGIKSGLTDLDGILRHTAMRILIEPEEMAASIFALTGPDFKRLTGANILIDAGWDSLSGLL